MMIETNEFGYPIGTVILSRSADERLNVSPGWWNHLAIYVGNGQNVESLESKGGVIKHSYKWLLDHPELGSYIIAVPRDELSGIAAAEKALTLVGRPYRKLASIIDRLIPSRRGDNCVSVVRKAYRYSEGFDPHWKIPDDVLKSTNIFEFMPEVKV